MPFTSYRINLLLPGWRFTFLAVSCDMRQNILRNIWLSLCLFQKILCSVGHGTRQFLEHKAFEATARRQPPDIRSVSQVNRTGSDGDSQAVIQDTLTNQPSGTRSEGLIHKRQSLQGTQCDSFICFKGVYENGPVKRQSSEVEDAVSMVPSWVVDSLSANTHPESDLSKWVDLDQGVIGALR